MAKASLTKVLDVDFGKFFDTIVGYENYPQFVTGCKKVEVERKAPGHCRVKYYASIMGKDLWYLLDHTENRETGIVTWKLIESDLLKIDDGTWTLKKVGEGKTEVTYSLEIDFKMWVPGPILKTLTATSLPMLIGEYERQAKK